MRRKLSGKWKRVAAYVAVLCMVLCNSGMSAFVSSAEGELMTSGEGTAAPDERPGVGTDGTEAEETAEDGTGQETPPTADRKRIKFNIYYKDVRNSLPLPLELKDKDGNIIPCESATGEYVVETGKAYDYCIPEKGIRQASGEAVPKADSDVIDIPVEFVEPEFTVNDQKWSDVGAIKSGTNISIKCENADKLYDLDNWKTTITGAEALLKENPTVSKNNLTEKISFQCYYKNFSKIEYKKDIFSEYSVKVVYYTDAEKKEYTEPVNGAAYNGMNPVAGRDLVLGTPVSLTAKAPGYRDNTVEVTPTAYDREVLVPVGDMILPEFDCSHGVDEDGNPMDSLDLYYGDSMDLNKLLKTFPNEIKWAWEWTLDGQIVSGTISGLETGSHTLIYGCKVYPYHACTMRVNVKKIPLKYDETEFDKWEVTEEKEYDTTAKFNLTIPVSSPAIQIEGDVISKANVAGKGGDIHVEATVAGPDAGTYDSFVITDVFLDDVTEKYYDISAVKGYLLDKQKRKKEAAGMEAGVTVSLKIKPRNILITEFIPQIQYHSKQLGVEETKSHIVFDTDADMQESEKKYFCDGVMNMLGDDVEVISDGRCRFPSVNGMVSTSAGNITTLGDGKNIVYGFDPKGMIWQNFQFQYIAEDLKDVYLAPHISLTMGESQEKAVPVIPAQLGENVYWCSNNSIFGQIHTGDFLGEDAYGEVTFEKVDDVSDWAQLDRNRLKASGEKGMPFIKTDTEEETYYKLIFHPSDAKYETCSVMAALVRVVPEAEVDKSGEYPSKIFGYSVITLLVDNSVAVVDFEGMDCDDLDRPKDWMIESKVGTDKAVRKEKISFEVKNGLSQVSAVEYAMVKIDREDKSRYDSEQKTFDVDGLEVGAFQSLKLTASGKYVVPIPEEVESGDLVLYVRVTNSSQVSATYISNAFIVDTVAPVTEFCFKESDSGEDVSNDVLNGKKVYRNQTVDVTIELTEEHFEKGTITVSRTDRKGVRIGEEESYEFHRTDKLEKWGVSFPLEESGNYRIEVLAEDQAGNYSHKADGKPAPEVYYITVDKDNPNMGEIGIAGTFHAISNSQDAKKGIVKTVSEILKKSWNAVAIQVTYNVFGDDAIRYTLEGSDEISPVSISYYLSDKGMTEEELKNLDEKQWMEWDAEKGGFIEVNTGCILYERVKDIVGNASYFNTDGIITDNDKPFLDVKVGGNPNANGFYKEDVRFDVAVEDRIPEGGSKASGLQYVAYRIEKEGKNEKSEVLRDDSAKKVAGRDNLSFAGVIKADEFNDNDISLYVTAVDNAGNMTVEKKTVMIDNVKPVISVKYNDAAGATYYNRERTATVTITERNLDVKDVSLYAKGEHGTSAKVGKWTHSDDIGISDAATYTCQVTFSEDDDYVFTVDCVDRAGNKAEKGFSDKFTLDITKPVIAVTYNGAAPEQNAYYKEPVTATITITEHNFSAEKVDIQVQAENDGVSGISGFNSNGDVHTATISYSVDGTYGLEVSYTDEAGNEAESYSGNRFTIDLIEPEIKITDIEDRSANKGEVKPVITCTDLNYAEDKVEIKLYGANHGEMNLEDVVMTTQAVSGGQQFAFDFPSKQAVDDLYTLSAKATDKAGNETEKSIEFSVNRFGSVYTLGDATGNWLTSGVCSYIQDGRPIVIVETNVDEVVDRNIAYSRGGVNASLVTLEEKDNCGPEEKNDGIYYEVKDNSSRNQWYQYEYTIHEGNFLSEGRYSVQIDSTDKAGNHTSNASNKHEGGNLTIDFAVDHTAPSAVITGAENGGVYNEEAHTLYLDVQDNMAMDYVAVYIDGKEYGNYTAVDIEKNENGRLPVKVKQSASMQTIQIKAKDVAGNILGESAHEKYDQNFEDFRILVTTNAFVRLAHSVWIWIILGGAALCTVLVVWIRRKKKIK